MKGKHEKQSTEFYKNYKQPLMNTGQISEKGNERHIHYITDLTNGPAE